MLLCFRVSATFKKKWELQSWKGSKTREGIEVALDWFDSFYLRFYLHIHQELSFHVEIFQGLAGADHQKYDYVRPSNPKKNIYTALLH